MPVKQPKSGKLRCSKCNTILDYWVLGNGLFRLHCSKCGWTMTDTKDRLTW